MAQSRKPVIGLTADSNEGQELSHPHFKGETIHWLKKQYTDAVADAGGVPLVIPVVAPAPRADPYLDMIDGLIVTGGYFDIDPALYGEKPIARIDAIRPDRTRMEMRLVKKAVRLGMPALGICGGCQAINVAFGGTLYQDLPTQRKKLLRHEQKSASTKPRHDVNTETGTALRRILGRGSVNVNSTHHQAVKTVGRGLTACATAPDGVIEAIESSSGGSFLLGVQWHPEQLCKTDENSRKLFKGFVKECRNYKASIKRQP